MTTQAGRTNEARVGGSGSARLRDLPSVNAVLTTQAASVLLERFGRSAATGAITGSGLVHGAHYLSKADAEGVL
jgi:hypothetical protein